MCLTNHNDSQIWLQMTRRTAAPRMPSPCMPCRISSPHMPSSISPISGASHSTILFLVAHRLFSVLFLQCLEPCIRQNDYRCSVCFIYFIYFLLLYIYNVILICLQYLWIIKNIYCMSDSKLYLLCYYIFIIYFLMVELLEDVIHQIKEI